ncbi:unnamed protein product [Lasius platythorax]|uniref:Myb-like domain-containing protein n=1 Tax=Lasius platythorax TaxID=488582 RepID=A0AAV2MY50_9HYME
MGKGVHHRRAHPDWFDAQQNTVATKARWTEEESLLFARKSELVQQGEKFINQALVKDFPERTLESIKSKRKQPAYRKVVADMLESTSAEMDDGTVTASDTGDNVDYKTTIVEFLASLPAPGDDSFSSARLARICNSLQRHERT